jgi:DsbC/DsbD-like thiol-disulfide interchange protein
MMGMYLHPRYVVALLAGWAIFLGSTAGALAGHVQTELLTSVSSIELGKPFWLGIRLTIDPGWHIYWENAGDAGLPTRVKFSLPDGFSAGPVLYPTPSRFVAPGNITMFGYENSVMLMAKITPPANLSADFQGQFKAAVHWLVCSDVCILGNSNLSLALGASGRASPVNRDVFDDWLAQVPQSAAGNPEVVRVDSNGLGRESIEVVWSHPAPQADFFPEAIDDYNITDIRVSSSQDRTSITFTPQLLAGRHPGATTLSAVLGYNDQEGNRRGVILSVALAGS